MSTLTRAELLSYPGATLTEKVICHSREHDLCGANALASSPASAPPRVLRRRIDIRRFSGRDRAERVMHYVRAHFPRAENWSEDAVREIARGLLSAAEIVE